MSYTKIKSHPLLNSKELIRLLDYIEMDSKMRKRIDKIREEEKIPDAFTQSRKFVVRREKFHRYIYNMNYEKAKEYFEKTKESLMEILEYSMENDTCMYDAETTDSLVEIHKNEGVALMVGKQMKQLTTYDKVLDAIKNYKD